MTESLSIALVLPHSWPPRDDVGWHVSALGQALASRGHRVTVLAPTLERERLVAGRDALRQLASGRPEAILAGPGEMRVVAVGRALPAGAGRRLPGPLDMASSLETALSLVPFDVVHVHEPLAPSPALAALRHTRGITVATFHGHDQLAGVAFLQPLVDRALGRVDHCTATTDVARRALTEILPREYSLIPGGVDTSVFAPPAAAPIGPPGLVVIARGRDRGGIRFAMRALRRVDVPAVGRITVLGPSDAPWRTRAAIPKALRPVAAAVADAGPASRAQAFARARIALVATAEDVASPAIAEAMACGMAVLAPRTDELERVLTHGREALSLPPFAAPAWAEAIDALAAEPARVRELGEAAAALARTRDWEVVAGELEALYRSALSGRSQGRAPRPRKRQRREGEVRVDLRVRVGPGLDAGTLVQACRERGISLVGVAAPGGIGPALAVAAAAPPDLQVIVGQEIATEDGVMVGLGLVRDVPEGLPLPAAAAAVHAQGGLLLAPSPASLPAPSSEVLRAHAATIDCYELVSAGSPAAALRAAELARRMGILAVAASGAMIGDEVGAVSMRIRPVDGLGDLVQALAEGELSRRRRTLIARPPLQDRPSRRRQ